MITTKKQHISYSELKDWVFCPHYHKKSWIEKVSQFEGNEYTAFGTAMHDVCEKKLLRENVDDEKAFQIGFDQELEKLAQKNIEVKFDSISNANHFYKKKEKELTDCINRYLKDKISVF